MERRRGEVFVVDDVDVVLATGVGVVGDGVDGVDEDGVAQEEHVPEGPSGV